MRTIQIRLFSSSLKFIWGILNFIKSHLLRSTSDFGGESFIGHDRGALAGGLLDRVLDGPKEHVIGVLVVFECETAVRDVVEILEPLEVGDSHTTRVDEHVRNDQDIALLQIWRRNHVFPGKILFLKEDQICQR